VKLILVAAVALAVAAGGTTWWALESGGVAIIETRNPSGGTRNTHVWYAEPNGEIWLEAGTPENAWLRDVLEDSAVVFRADGRTERYVAEPVNEPEGHERIRSLMREKYGVRDVWVGLLFDTTHSVGVRLVPDRSSDP
jgi:hypothetical protein